jgi:glycolate oxidase FAD binding subunit
VGLVLDPPLPAAATIGGIVATNASGPRRLRYGAARDQIIGIRVVLADGTVAKGGGKVVKNVAGYDLPKLFCGALGTLGVVVAANFRLYPLTVYSGTVIFATTTIEPLCELARSLTASTLTPTAIDLLGPEDGTHTCVLAARFESGVAASVHNQSSALLALAGNLSGKARARAVLEGEEENQFWRAAAERMSEPDGDAGPEAVHLRANLLPSEVGAWLGRLEAVSRSAELSLRWRAHLGHGIVDAWIAGDAERMSGLVEEVRAEARNSRGNLVVVEASPDVLRRLDVWGSVSALDLMRRLKQRFDPNFTLNPGRFVGGI